MSRKRWSSKTPHPCDPGKCPKVCDRCGKKKPLGNRAGSPQWLCDECDKALSPSMFG